MKKLLQLCSVLMLGLMFLAGNAQAQTIYLAGSSAPSSDANSCLTDAAPCATLAGALTKVSADGAVIYVYGNTNETVTAEWPAFNNVTVRGVVSSVNITPAQWTITDTTIGNDTNIINFGVGTNGTLRDLILTFSAIGTYGQGRFVRVAADGFTIDNVTFQGGNTTATSRGPAIVIPDAGGTNLTVRNSTFQGNYARRTVELTDGSGHSIVNNLFAENHVGTAVNFTGTAPFAGNGASIFHGINAVTDINISFNRFLTTVTNAAAGENGTYSAIYFTSTQPFSAGNEFVIDHNTIDINGAAYTLGDVNGITFGSVPADIANLVTSLTNGWIRVTNNIIMGANDIGVSIPVAFGTTNLSHNLFHGNGTNSNNVIETAPNPGMNIAHPADLGTNPNFDPGTGLMRGLLATSPAFGTSSSGVGPYPNPFDVPFDQVSPNIGYNQVANTNAPMISALTATGTPSFPVVADEFLTNEDITVSWAFTDIDPQDANQTNFILRVERTSDNFVVVGPFNGNVDGPLLGANLSYLIPANTLAQDEEYEVFVEVFDSIGLSDSDSHVFTTAANTAPTASGFLVDGFGPNVPPANGVTNTNPAFSFVYDDIDGDNMASYRIRVWRTSQNCGATCDDLLTPVSNPYPDTPPGAINGLLIADELVVPGAPVAPGAPVSVNYNQLIPILGSMLPGETYVWELMVSDGALSSTYDDNSGDGAGVMNFETLSAMDPTIADLTVDGKDNSVSPRVVLGTGATPSTFGWTYTGFEDMAAFEIRVVRTPGFTVNPVTGAYENPDPTRVWYTGIIPASSATEGDPNEFTYTSPVPMPLAQNQTYHMQIRVYDKLNQRSDWYAIEYARNLAPQTTVASGFGLAADGLALDGTPQLIKTKFPLLTWTFADPNLPGDDSQSDFDIEVALDNSFVPIIAAASVTGGGTGASFQVPDNVLAYNTAYHVRIRTYDALGLASGWTQYMFATPQDAAPLVAITAVTGMVTEGGVNYNVDGAPIGVTFSFDDPTTEERPMADFKVEVRDAVGDALVASTGWLTDADLTPAGPVLDGGSGTYLFDPADFTVLALALTDGADYKIEILARDAGSALEGTTDEPAISPTSYLFSYENTPSAPTLAFLPGETRANGDIGSQTPTLVITPVDLDGPANPNASYTVEIAGPTSHGPQTVSGPFTPGTAYNFVTPVTLAPGAYTATVFTSDVYGDGAPQVVNFTVNPIPAAATDVAISIQPTFTDQMNLPNGPTFNIAWTNNDLGEDAAAFRLVIRDPSDTSNLEVLPITAVSGTNSGTFTPSVALTPGATYPFRLRVGDAASLLAPTVNEFSGNATGTFRISAAPVVDAAELLTDGEFENDAVDNVFPVLDWSAAWSDADGDAQAEIQIVLTRTTDNCLGGVGCGVSLPHLVWDSGRIAHTDLFIAVPPLVDGIRPGEDYRWTIVTWDANGIASAMQQTVFSTVDNVQAGLSNVTLDNQTYTFGAPANRFPNDPLNVETATPTFRWAFGGPGTQIRYQIDVFDNPALTGAPHWSANVASAANEVVYSGPALSDAAPYYARVRVQSSSTTFSEYFYIAFELNVAPDMVTGVTVDDKPVGAVLGSAAVADSRKPVFKWTFADDNAVDGQSGFTIQITDAINFNSIIAGGSFTEVSANSEFQIPAPVLQFDTPYGVRIIVRDVHEVESVAFEGVFRTPANTDPVASDLLVLNGATEVPDYTRVQTLTPSFSWTFADADAGDVQGFYRLTVMQGMTPVYDSGAMPYIGSATPAHGFDDIYCVPTPGACTFAWGTAYTASVTVWDSAQDPNEFNAEDVVGASAGMTTSVGFTTSPAYLTATGFVISPATVNLGNAATATATMSQAGNYITLIYTDGSSDFFHGSYTSATATVNVNLATGLTPPQLNVGSYVFRAYETPFELTGTPSELIALISAYATPGLPDFLSAGLTVTGGAIDYGDVNGDTFITTLDAQLVLQEEAQLTVLTAPQRARADVDGNNVVDSNDASQILAAAAIAPTDYCFPIEVCKSAGVVAFEGGFRLGEATRDGAAWVVPVFVDGNTGVTALSLLVSSQEGVEFAANLPKEWLRASNSLEAGLKIASAGLNALADAKVGEFRIVTDAETVTLSVSGSANGVALDAVTSEVSTVELPDEFSLGQNFPNPFNPSTEIRFSLPADAPVTLEVYSVQGQKVATLVSRPMSAGVHTVRFDAGRLASGVYIYTLQAGAFRATQKMTLIK